MLTGLIASSPGRFKPQGKKAGLRSMTIPPAWLPRMANQMSIIAVGTKGAAQVALSKIQGDNPSHGRAGREKRTWRKACS